MKVSFIAPIYNYRPVLVECLLNQTHSDWELILMHDFANTTGLADYLRQINDPRIKYFETPVRYNDWGHSLRALGLKEVADDADFIVHTNADNMYVPGFCEKLIPCFKDYVNGCYCDCLHNYWGWDYLACSLAITRIDCGCMMFRANVAKDIGWPYRIECADWSMIEDACDKYGKDTFVRFPKALFIHN